MRGDRVPEDKHRYGIVLSLVAAALVAVLVLVGPMGGAVEQQAKLTASDAEDWALFGESVAVDGDTAIIGTDVDDAYVFTRSDGTWTQQRKFTGAALQDDEFGQWVALDGDTALVGAPLDNGDGTDRGAAYVFTRSGGSWTQQTKLTASDAHDNDLFGNVVALDGDTALVGAPADDGPGTDRGAAYVFTRSGDSWTEQAKLTASDGENGDELGSSVALDGDTALVGAWREDGSGTDRGAAYVFTRRDGTWAEQAMLTAADPADYANFGLSAALDGERAVIGNDSIRWGAAYAFVRKGTGWSQQAKLTAGNGEKGDGFGSAVALDGGTVLIGAPEQDDGGTERGVAYAYTSGTRSSNQPPAATFNVICDVLTCTADAAASSDPDGSIASYDWDWGDGSSHGYGVEASHAYESEGTYTVTLTITDDAGASDTASETVDIDRSGGQHGPTQPGVGGLGLVVAVGAALVLCRRRGRGP